MATTLREDILGFVRKYPGVHPREVERQMGLPTKLASYHLDALVDEGLLRRVDESGFARYVPVGAHAQFTQKELAFTFLMRRGPPLRITLLLLSEGTLTPGAMADALGLAKASVSYHLAAMLESGFARVEKQGRERHYSLVDARHAQEMLERFRPLPGELDSFTRLWNDLVG